MLRALFCGGGVFPEIKASPSAKFLSCFVGELDGNAVLLDLQLVRLGLAAIILRRKIMGQINHKAEFGRRPRPSVAPPPPPPSAQGPEQPDDGRRWGVQTLPRYEDIGALGALNSG